MIKFELKVLGSPLVSPSQIWRRRSTMRWALAPPLRFPFATAMAMAIHSSPPTAQIDVQGRQTCGAYSHIRRFDLGRSEISPTMSQNFLMINHALYLCTESILSDKYFQI